MSLEMASSSFSYHRLKKAAEIEGEEVEEQERLVLKQKRRWWRFRRTSSRRRRLRIPGLNKLRRKSRQLSVSCIKVWKRLKQSRSHWGDLFAGNYMFMQVSPAPLGFLEKSFMGHDHAIPSLKRVA